MTAPARHLRPVPTSGPRLLHGTDLPAIPSGLFFAEFDEDDPREFIVDFDAAAVYLRAELSPLQARRVWAEALVEYVMRAPCWADEPVAVG